MHRFYTPFLRRLYVFTGAFLVLYYSVVLFENSTWNKERLYRKLLLGTEDDKLKAVADLIYLRGQEQLVRALKSRSPEVREIAANSLWDLWFHEAGNKAFQLTQAAQKAAERGAFPKALAILTELTQEYPDFAEGWNRRGTLYWQLGEFEKAIDDARRVVALKPDHFGAWQGMGLCQLRLGDVAGARASFRAALKISPHDRGLREFLWRCDELLRQSPPERRNRDDLI